MPDSNPPQPISSYTRKVWIAAGIGALVVGMSFLLWHGFEIFLLVFAGFCWASARHFSVGARPLAESS